MAINRWRSWLATFAAISLGVAGSLFAGQTSQSTTVHGITSTGVASSMQESARRHQRDDGHDRLADSTEFVLTHAVTVIPGADERTGFSSAKATVPNRLSWRTDAPDRYGLMVEPDHAIPHAGQQVAITGTMRGSQLKVHSIRMIWPVCQ